MHLSAIVRSLLLLTIVAGAPAHAQVREVTALRLSPSWFDFDDDKSPPAARPLAKKKHKGHKKHKSSSKFEIAAMDTGEGVAPMLRTTGVGLQLGSPVALSGKFMLTGNQGVQGGIGFGLGGISLHVDYLWHPHVLVRAEPFKISWYVGGGVWAAFYPPFPGSGFSFANPGPGFVNGYYGYVYVPWQFTFGTSLAARAPLGLSLALAELPIEFFVELVPAMLVFPGIGFGLGGGVGARVYF